MAEKNQYVCQILKNNFLFDELDFTSIEKCKEWARSGNHACNENSFKVVIYRNGEFLESFDINN